MIQKKFKDEKLKYDIWAYNPEIKQEKIVDGTIQGKAQVEVIVKNWGPVDNHFWKVGPIEVEFNASNQGNSYEVKTSFPYLIEKTIFLINSWVPYNK